jgi:hypothetical protein
MFIQKLKLRIFTAKLAEQRLLDSFTRSFLLTHVLYQTQDRSRLYSSCKLYKNRMTEQIPLSCVIIFPVCWQRSSSPS